MKLLFNLFYILFFGIAIALATDNYTLEIFGVPISYSVVFMGAVLLIGLIPKQLPSNSFFTTIDTTGLTAYVGKTYNKIITDMINKLDFVNDVFVHVNVKNKVRLNKFAVLDGIRPFSSDEETKGGNLIYTDHFLNVLPAKREIPIDPEEYRETFLSENLMPGSAATQAPAQTIPFWPWTLGEISKSIAKEMNDKTAFFGFDNSTATAINGAGHAVGDYITITVDGIMEYFKCIATAAGGETPITHPAKWKNSTAEAICKGIGTILENYVTSADIVEQGIGAISTPAEAIAAQKELIRSHSNSMKSGNILTLQSNTDFELLMDGIDDLAKYAVYDQTRKEKVQYLVIPGTFGKGFAKPCSWMGGSRRLISGEAKMVQGNMKLPNIHFGTDLMNDMNKVKVRDQSLWKIILGYKWLMGFEFENLNNLRINDQS
jgi:hypothetical protein